MPQTTNIVDFEALATAIAACGGVVPDPIGRLLLAHRLLNAPASTEKPETPLLSAALDGDLDEKTLNKLLPAAAIAAMTAQYRAELAGRAEHVIVGQLHRELAVGCADQILDGLRDCFDAQAKQIAVARSLISAESDPAHVLASGEPGTIEAWQSLDGHVRAVAAIGAIAIQFGPRIGIFPQIREYAGAENFRLSDAAIMCCDGPIIQESALFQSPDRGHRTSPWARTQLKLHTIESATAHYNGFAAAEFDRQHDRDLGGWVDQETGQVHKHPVPKNPYRHETADT